MDLRNFHMPFAARRARDIGATVDMGFGLCPGFVGGTLPTFSVTRSDRRSPVICVSAKKKKKRKGPVTRPPPTRRVDQVVEILRVVWKRHNFIRGSDIARIVDRIGRDSVRPYSIPFVRTIRGPYHKRMNLIRFLAVNLLPEVSTCDVADILHGFGLMEVDPREDLWAMLVNRIEDEIDQLSEYYLTNVAVGFFRLRRALTPSLHAKISSFKFRILSRVILDGEEEDFKLDKIRKEMDFAQYMFWMSPRAPKKRPVRGTAWQTESNITLQFHEREFSPSPMTLTTKVLRRKLFEKTGIFFDTALIEEWKDGSVGSTYEEYPRASWRQERFTTNTALVTIGFVRRVGIRRRSFAAEEAIHCIYLDHGDVLFMFDGFEEAFEHRIFLEERAIFAEESITFLFLQSKAAAELGETPIPSCLEIPQGSIPPVPPHDPKTIDLAGINRVEKVYTLEEDIDFMYEPLTPESLGDFKLAHHQDPKLGPLTLDPRRPPPSGEAVPTQVVDELDDFFVN
mmetsp:Transcript_12799/g.25966  ORF Transcript_12799/g.25966 Transcript_12799/m.25966 type:complete len:510 (-) Transcript_12799:1711-3240(-)|eukprot:CAMPEP_0184681216 /NCGR_PEP_ID=MMETSP0312-20130426/4171_1 /TAXON_ID=31354 /ORGANISM="Compsopogon coeruleus, Strain SAG 36.94" /LENGTH=509 /DNA_ID=CAMNT_0027131897 /DNA_START=100 /DNA_END=1632 /DNA_ORIENTATION=-